ncbi:capsid assembly scaffolding protein Gp46 family protein [Nicoliella lavandulae]|uniref:DUF4355 domain-containing protein n=1 Tax=Nicoliella lavandulae TaxID=3082954 RepID=A0ABU8SM93_9LACO
MPEEDKLKYTQDQVNKMLAQKDKESYEKGRNEALDSFKDKTIFTSDELTAKRNEWLKKGEERAAMSAEEKAKAAFKDQQDSLAAEKQKVAEDRQSMASERAVYSAQSELSKLGLDTNLASFVADVDSDKQSEKIKALQDAFTKSNDEATKKALEGKENPQSGDNSQGGAPKDKKVEDMTLAEQMAYYNEHPDELN